MVEDMCSILQKVGFFFCHWQSHKQYILSFPVFVLPRWKWNRCKTQLDNMHYGNFFECGCCSRSFCLKWFLLIYCTKCFADFLPRYFPVFFNLFAYFKAFKTTIEYVFSALRNVTNVWMNSTTTLVLSLLGPNHCNTF